MATDGGLRFDLTRFNPAYFARLRARVQALNRAGIYAGVYLFTGEWLAAFRSSTDGYPYYGPNNVNGVDDGYRGGSSGVNAVTMTAPFMRAYTELLVRTCHKRGAHAIGGMAAFIPSRRDPEPSP